RRSRDAWLPGRELRAKPPPASHAALRLVQRAASGTADLGVLSVSPPLGGRPGPGVDRIPDQSLHDRVLALGRTGKVQYVTDDRPVGEPRAVRYGSGVLYWTAVLVKGARADRGFAGAARKSRTTSVGALTRITLRRVIVRLSATRASRPPRASRDAA